jgi:predicted O-methyltransferase YrrM
MNKKKKLLDKLKSDLKNVDGFIMDEEAVLLYKLANKAKKPIIEIGSWKGKSTICLAKGSQDGYQPKVYAIDPFTGSSEHGRVWTYPEFEKNISTAEIDNLVVSLIKTSAEAVKDWSEEIDLVWIDGAHEYDQVKSDFENWLPHLRKGGMVAMHDTKPGGKAGPYRVILENIVYSNKYKLKFLNFTKLTACFEKVSSVSIFNRIKFLILFYFRAFISLFHIQILKFISKWRT